MQAVLLAGLVLYPPRGDTAHRQMNAIILHTITVVPRIDTVSLPRERVRILTMGNYLQIEIPFLHMQSTDKRVLAIFLFENYTTNSTNELFSMLLLIYLQYWYKETTKRC